MPLNENSTPDVASLINSLKEASLSVVISGSMSSLRTIASAQMPMTSAKGTLVNRLTTSREHMYPFSERPLVLTASIKVKLSFTQRAPKYLTTGLNNSHSLFEMEYWAEPHMDSIGGFSHVYL